jgi:hypothetical protein
VKLVAQREREQTLLHRRRRYFQTVLTHSVLNEWIRANTELKDGIEIQRLRETVQSFLREDRIQELKLYLTDVLNSGKKVADKQHKRRRRGGWAWFGYSFTIIRGIVYVGAVLAVFTVAESRFQKVSLAVLIMIGNMLLTNRASDGLYRLRLGAVMDGQFNLLRRFFKFPEDEEERDARNEARIDSDKTVTRTTISIYIGFVFEFLVWVICVVELVATLW